ncbi:EAL domain-containing protein, partial [Paraburkholderia phymatum]
LADKRLSLGRRLCKMPEGDPLRYITQAAQNAPNSHRFTCSRSTMIHIGEILKLTVTAEGVETHAQRDFLGTHGCHLYQGFLFSPPLAPRDFARWVQKHRPCSSPREADTKATPFGATPA